MKKIAFNPIVSKDSCILLLGTMPSEESLRIQEYYGHKSNQFWKIIFTLFEKSISTNYKEKIALLLEYRIALWDVLAGCEGIGSADSNIKNEKPNNFKIFFDDYPLINHIFFTSKKAEEFYKKYIGFDENKTYITLPSPSPANAAISLSQKVEKWQILLDTIKNME